MRAKKFTISHIITGFVAVLIGFTTSAALVFESAQITGASSQEISSWIFALGLSMFITCISLSVYYKVPVLTGWSTAGAAILVTSLQGFTLPQAIGAFVFASALTLLVGITGIFEKFIDHIPKSLTSAMLAGILLHFGINIFIAMQNQLTLILTMLCAYLISKRFVPNLSILIVVCIGFAIANMEGLYNLNNFGVSMPKLIYIKPEFSLQAIISVGLPLFIITMTSQNLPGIAVLNNANYHPNFSKILSFVGLINLLLAPFGSFSICLAAITAAICCSQDVDPNPKERYKSTVFAGIFWIIVGLLGPSIVTIFSAFPAALIAAVAGIALLNTIGSSLYNALHFDKEREPALITILVAASGINLFGVGAAFWGLIAGIMASIILKSKVSKRFVQTQDVGQRESLKATVAVESQTVE